MYSTCLYCSGKLGMNDMIERFPIGQRLAFDPAKGRLWAVCPNCHRWNLTPIEERFEAVEDCERLYRRTYVRVSTGNVGLAKLRDGTELVRIGAPLRPEFAAWRYAGEFFSRRTLSYARAAATVVGATGVSIGTGAYLAPAALALTGPLSLVAMPLLTMAAVGGTALGGAMTEDYMHFERILARFRIGKRTIRVRAKHARNIALGFHGEGKATIGMQHDRGWAELEGPRAMHAATVLLASMNQRGGSARGVQAAVDQIEKAGNAARFLGAASKRNGWRGFRTMSVLNSYRRIGPMNLNDTERLAMEMAMHEEIERRAAEGELTALRAAWIEAEEIASIVDGMLTPFQ